MNHKLWPHLLRLAALFRRLRGIALEAKRPCWLLTSPSSSPITVHTGIPTLPDKHPVPQEIFETFWESAKNPEPEKKEKRKKAKKAKKARSEDAASLPNSGEEAKGETEKPKLSPCTEWENLRRELATQVAEEDSKQRLSSNSEPFTTDNGDNDADQTATKNESIIEGSPLVGSSQPETSQRTRSDAD